MTMCEQKTESGIVESMPPKLHSLRGSSLARRLEAEARRRQPRQRLPTQTPGKPKLSKYRRKCANAKERERMSRVNEMFDKLKTIVPEGLTKHEEDAKETKVTTLRSAITYINELQSLLVDYDTGSLDPNQYRFITDKENLHKSNKKSRNNSSAVRKISGKFMMKSKRLNKKSAKAKSQKSKRSGSSASSGLSRTPSPISQTPVSPTQLFPVQHTHSTPQLMSTETAILACAVPEPSVEYVVYQTLPDASPVQHHPHPQLSPVHHPHPQLQQTVIPVVDIPRNYVVYGGSETDGAVLEKEYVVYEDNTTNSLSGNVQSSVEQSKDVNVINLYISLIDGKRATGF